MISPPLLRVCIVPVCAVCWPFMPVSERQTHVDSFLYMTPNILSPQNKKSLHAENGCNRNRKTMKNGEIYNFVFFSKGLFFVLEFCLLLSLVLLVFRFSTESDFLCNFLSFLLFYTFYLLPLHSCFLSFLFFFYTTFSLLCVSDSLILYIKRTARKTVRLRFPYR